MPDVMPFQTPEGGMGVNGVFLPVVTKTAAYTATSGDQVILADATAGAFSVTLPAAADSFKQGRGDSFTIIKIDSGANAVTIDGNASETINGSTTKVLSKQFAGLTIRSDGSNWVIESGAYSPGAAIVTLTDNTGLSGTHDDTLAATTVPAAITGGESPTEAEHNAVLTLLGVIVQNASDTAQKVLEIRTALINAGIIVP